MILFLKKEILNLRILKSLKHRFRFRLFLILDKRFCIKYFFKFYFKFMITLILYFSNFVFRSNKV